MVLAHDLFQDSDKTDRDIVATKMWLIDVKGMDVSQPMWLSGCRVTNSKPG